MSDVVDQHFFSELIDSSSHGCYTEGIQTHVPVSERKASVKTNRREFIKTAAAGVAVAAIGSLPSVAGEPADDEKKDDKVSRPLDLTYVTYCGLYCKLCATIGRIPKQSAQLLDSLVKEGYEYFGDKELLEKLRKESKSGEGFKGCRGGACSARDYSCEIPKCAKERNLDVCSSCKDYPCDKVKAVAKRYPNLLADGARQKEIGLAKWIEEQEERCKTGFCYVDIRFP